MVCVRVIVDYVMVPPTEQDQILIISWHFGNRLERVVPSAAFAFCLDVADLADHFSTSTSGETQILNAHLFPDFAKRRLITATLGPRDHFVRVLVLSHGFLIGRCDSQYEFCLPSNR